MRIEHLAIWTDDIERLRSFYIDYFAVQSNDKYVNLSKGFESYFLSFKEGCRLEIMTDSNSLEIRAEGSRKIGLAHFAISTGSKEKVLELTGKLRTNGYIIAGAPRVTGDGYFESVICDPDGNLIELTI